MDFDKNDDHDANHSIKETNTNIEKQQTEMKTNRIDNEMYDSWIFIGEPKRSIKLESLINQEKPTTTKPEIDVAQLNDQIVDDITLEEPEINEHVSSDVKVVVDLASVPSDEIDTTDIDGNDDDDDCPSDGISIISENDWSRRSPYISLATTENKDEINIPPKTKEESDFEEARYFPNFDINSHGINWIFFGIFAVLITISLGQFFIYDSDNTNFSNITPLVRRIKELEAENDALKTEIVKMSDDRLVLPEKVLIPQKPLEYIVGSGLVEPIISSGIREKRQNEKMVWSGDSEMDEPIIVPRRKKKKSSDFCDDDILSKDTRVNEQSTQTETQQSTPTIIKKTVKPTNKTCKTISKKSSTLPPKPSVDSKKKPVRPKFTRQANFIDDEEFDRLLAESVFNENVEKKKVERRKIIIKKNSENKNSKIDSMCIECDTTHKPKRKLIVEKENKLKKKKIIDNKKENIDSEWHNKMMKNREQMRKTKTSQLDDMENWYFERASDREKYRSEFSNKKYRI